MKAGTLEVFKIFSSILDEKQAEKVIEYIENVNETEITSHVEQKIENMATKVDLANTKADLEVKIAQTKAEIIKWMFIFWITQTLTILGVMAYLIKN